MQPGGRSPLDMFAVCGREAGRHRGGAAGPVLRAGRYFDNDATATRLPARVADLAENTRALTIATGFERKVGASLIAVGLP